VKEVKRRAGGGRCLFKKPLLLGIHNEKKIIRNKQDNRELVCKKKKEDKKSS